MCIRTNASVRGLRADQCLQFSCQTPNPPNANKTSNLARGTTYDVPFRKKNNAVTGRLAQQLQANVKWPKRPTRSEPERPERSEPERPERSEPERPCPQNLRLRVPMRGSVAAARGTAAGGTALAFHATLRPRCFIRRHLRNDPQCHLQCPGEAMVLALLDALVDALAPTLFVPFVETFHTV